MAAGGNEVDVVKTIFSPFLNAFEKRACGQRKQKPALMHNAGFLFW